MAGESLQQISTYTELRAPWPHVRWRPYHSFTATTTIRHRCELSKVRDRAGYSFDRSTCRLLWHSIPTVRLLTNHRSMPVDYQRQQSAYYNRHCTKVQPRAQWDLHLPTFCRLPMHQYSQVRNVIAELDAFLSIRDCKPIQCKMHWYRHMWHILLIMLLKLTS